MTQPPFKPFWPKDENVGIGDNPKRIDLGKPDAEAVKLAETLKTVQSSMIFSRVAIFTAKWILRPLIWWPIKLIGLSWLKMMAIDKASAPGNARRRRELQRRREDEAQFGRVI